MMQMKKTVTYLSEIDALTVIQCCDYWSVDLLEFHCTSQMGKAKNYGEAQILLGMMISGMHMHVWGY